jgi:hypothetical protein
MGKFSFFNSSGHLTGTSVLTLQTLAAQYTCRSHLQAVIGRWARFENSMIAKPAEEVLSS